MTDGSYSVEAAIIMPAVILITIEFLLLGFYMHDVVFAEAYGRNILAIQKNGSIDNGRLQMELQESMWYSYVREFDIYENGDKSVIQYKIVSKSDFFKLSTENRIAVKNEENISGKIQKWKIYIDTIKGLF